MFSIGWHSLVMCLIYVNRNIISLNWKHEPNFQGNRAAVDLIFLKNQPLATGTKVLSLAAANYIGELQLDFYLCRKGFDFCKLGIRRFEYPICKTSVAGIVATNDGGKTTMAVGGVTGANDMMMQLMQILMQGMQEQMDLSKKMLAVGVENGMIAEKMATAQNIIDVYA